MGRFSVCEKTGLRKGAWSPEEDKRLVTCINIHGPWNWRELPKYAGLARCGKSCRLRWLNYLRPTIKRGNYTREEDNLILAFHAKHGNKWSKIAEKLPGRTDNEIKNHWHTHLSKQFARSNKGKSKNIGCEKLGKSSVFSGNYFPHDYMTPSILESSTTSPTSSQSSTGYSSCTVDDKVVSPKYKVRYETSISSEPSETFVFSSSSLPSPISPLGEVIHSFCSSTGHDNDMFSSSTVRNQLTGMPWERNMMDDCVTSSFIKSSILPPLTPFTETFYPYDLYNCNDSVTMASAVLSEQNFEQTAHVLGESICSEYKQGEFSSPFEEEVFRCSLWE
ncbi:hypothetical protein ACHQM5_003303 [Ranunculus cassubicifolius]